ncbi:MAG: hypothetical protein PF518_04935 [Spirochaetaceae bacterium]|jgi:hypothetical protein|nr:hypothetical protein [Spirochaetaceae bacterium]
MSRCIYLKVRYEHLLEEFPSFDASGSIRGMKKHYYGKDALLVQCGSSIYNVSSKPSLYDFAGRQ